MYLKRLDIFGFKSFCDKISIAFKPGITAIVGPNGCGKSNLSDAILWVLGEQSAKTLRGERMEDVLFSGTEMRKALGMAEVSLTFGDVADQLPPPYTPCSEVTVSRRLFRSGESEYLINKVPCRLKDIRDLLIDTGAGYRVHTIIEQGKVEDLINASPLQRREMVEEVAGITKYRIRKVEALRKLEATEQNLTRVRDIIGEIKRQVHTLDRQVKRAEQHQKLKETLKSLDLQIGKVEWDGWINACETLEREEMYLKDTAASQEAELSALECRQAESRLALTQKEQELAEDNKRGYEITGKIQRLEGKIEFIQAQRKEWEGNRSRAGQEIEEIKKEEKGLHSETEYLLREKVEIEAILPEKEQQLCRCEEGAGRLQADVVRQGKELEQERVVLVQLTSDLVQSKNDLNHVELRKTELLRKKERGVQELHDVETKRQTAEAQASLLRERLKDVEIRQTEKSAARITLMARLDKLETELKARSKEVIQLKEEWAATSAQVTTRQDFYLGMLGSVGHVQFDGFQGMIADLIEVPARYETAIEAVLSDRLRGVVMQGHDEIKRGLDHLRNSKMGRAIFFPRQPRLLNKMEGVPDGEGVIGRARDLISCREGYEAVAELLLGRVVVVSDLDAALCCFGSSADNTYVTLDGEVLDPAGAVAGGVDTGSGLLEQKRELQRLSANGVRIQDQMNLLSDQIGQTERGCGEIRAQVEVLGREILSLDMARLDLEKDQGTLMGEIDRLQNAYETVSLEMEEMVKEEETLLAMEQRARDQILEIEKLTGEKQEALRLRQGEMDLLQQSLDASKEEEVELKIKIASLKERRDHISRNLTRVERTLRERTQHLEEKEQLLSSLHEKEVLSEVEEKEAITGIEQYAAERAALLVLIREKAASQTAISENLGSLERAIEGLRVARHQTEKSLQENALRKMEAEMNKNKIQETILAGYQAEIATCPEPETSFDLETAREQAARYRKSLDDIGPVNIGAIDEHKELMTRYQFLTAQEGDLTGAMENLRETISKINQTTQGLFVDTFHLLNQKFCEVFVSFFGGGKVELVLLDEEHPLESGIDLLVQLPGKGRRHNTLLSGGEKALTAISLLLATFLIHPSPFCVLDEIDAPLDEENTWRFTQALVKMSNQTQFMLITHNRRSMEIADVLYGVTMQETGISRLVSVKLKEEEPSIAHPIETQVEVG